MVTSGPNIHCVPLEIAVKASAYKIAGMSHSVPVPPPLPVLDIGERKVCSPVPKPLDLWDEAARIAQKLSLENPSEPDREPFIYSTLVLKLTSSPLCYNKGRPMIPMPIISRRCNKVTRLIGQ
ncbi:unnamed protein product [Notodromas monacha]|uniref:Uncharacterized protein n=1 Tax=Notodromas monacha TaxID=399045 RepID=A0A7R9C2V6_9CRUS|nr:unnamed protein product [Notodromas monacha]CAG0925177.1 unnamed protein product [Notodromas monacha]